MASMSFSRLVQMKEEAEKARHGFLALVFDFDGLILDTEVPDYESWREVYETHGGTLSLEKWSSYIGLGAASTPFNPYEHLQSQVPHVLDREAIRAQRRELYVDRVQAQPILPGIEDYIATAKRLGLKLAVASSSDCPWVTGHLLRLNLFHHFDVIKCADHVVNTKPHPELYLAAVKALGVQPHEAIAFEDSSHGVSSAKAAGLQAVAIPNAMTHLLPLEHADLRLNSLADMPLETLLKTLEQNQPKE
jgi:HAD superfamily hydrolase (TIGR01509 family)